MADNNDQELTRQEKKSWKVLGKYSTLSPAGVASQGLMLYHTNWIAYSVAFAYSTPVLAATLSLLVYTKLHPDFDVSVIFASLSLFQLLRQPMMLLPRALTAITDSKNAFQRLSKVFEAELMPDEFVKVDRSQQYALDVQDATFEWEETQGETTKKPFQVKNITMQIKRGSLTAIVGRIGSGKSSLVQGLISEMRKISGEVSFGGELAYCSQIAWIQNATLVREFNVGCGWY